MRVLITIMALATLALAQDQPAAGTKPTLKDGKLTDPVWNLTFEAPGLAKGLALGGANMIFEGNCDGDVTLEIKVYEGPDAAEAKEWKKRVKELWAKQGRKLQDVTEGDEPHPWVLFVEESLAGFNRHHGYMWYARGNHCFEVHGQINEKSETSGTTIQNALKGLTLGEDPGVSMLVIVLAQRMGKPVDDPLVILSAAIQYGSVQNPQRNPAMALRLFEKARELDQKGAYELPASHVLYLQGGMLLLVEPLRDGKKSAPWWEEAEKRAKTLPENAAENAASDAYNLACAYSVGGEVDKAYEAMYRSFAYTATPPVDDNHLAQDSDLDNMKKDAERWQKFMAEKATLFKPEEKDAGAGGAGAGEGG